MFVNCSAPLVSLFPRMESVAVGTVFAVLTRPARYPKTSQFLQFSASQLLLSECASSFARNLQIAPSTPGTMKLASLSFSVICMLLVKKSLKSAQTAILEVQTVQTLAVAYRSTPLVKVAETFKTKES